MKVSYLFPIFESDNSEKFFEGFLKSSFFCENKDYELIIYTCKEDKTNYEFLEKLAKKDKKIKLNSLAKDFSYNDAFQSGIKLFTGDVLLLGDSKISNVDLVFKKCLEKHQDGAQIVFVNHKKKGFKGWCKGVNEKAYNLFIKMYTDKKDACNITSLGLYDKSVIQILKYLPNKACFLKNTKDLYEIPTKTIFIDDDIKVYKPKLKKKPFAFWLTFSSFLLTLLSLITCIFLNVFIKHDLTTLNIIFVITIFILLVAGILALPKYLYDIRNMVNYDIFEKEREEYLSKREEIEKEIEEHNKAVEVVYKKIDLLEEEQTVKQEEKEEETFVPILKEQDDNYNNPTKKTTPQKVVSKEQKDDTVKNSKTNKKVAKKSPKKTVSTKKTVKESKSSKENKVSTKNKSKKEEK